MKSLLKSILSTVVLFYICIFNYVESVSLNLSSHKFLGMGLKIKGNNNSPSGDEFEELKNLISDNVLIQDDTSSVLTNYAAIVYTSATTGNKFRLVNKPITDKNKIVAEIHYHETLLQKGWDKLSLHTYNGDANTSSFLQAYMGGYLEGRISYSSINTFFINIEYNYSKQDKGLRLIKEIKKFFSDVDKNMKTKVTDNSFEEVFKKEEDRDYYYKIYIFYAQLKGLLRGYNEAVEGFDKSKTSDNLDKSGQKFKKLKIEDLLLLQADGEVPELKRFLNYKLSGRKYRLGETDYFKYAFDMPTENPSKVWNRLMRGSRCSAMIKIVTDAEENITDLYAGHNAWSDYSEAYRTIKHYSLDFKDYRNNTHKIETTFSSYPGALSSTDDYYVTNNRLLVTETTLEVIDINLYDSVKKANKYIPNFMRVNSATFFSMSAEEWVTNFSYLNSGTYSSQWMVLDYKVFDKVKGSKVANNQKKLLYVLEQTPGSIIQHDVSDYLFNNTYFASFNRAFFSETEDSLNMQLIKSLYGDTFSFQESSRGKIFKHLEGGVKNFTNFKNVLRYNGFKDESSEASFPDDPSRSNPGHGISARFDLEDKELNNLSGAIDCKLTNSDMIQKVTSVIVSGPTTENNPNLVPFDWDDYKDLDIRHVGLPQKYNFKWLMASPKNIKENKDNDIYEFE